MGGYYHTVALKGDGGVYAWGDNAYGQVGDGTTTGRSSPVQVAGLSSMGLISAGGYFSLTGPGEPVEVATAYAYDRLYRLTGVDRIGEERSYAYDPAGNRSSRDSTSYSYDRADRITSAGGVSYTVDGAGNLVTRGGDSFGYDGANRLLAASVGGTSSGYAYDGDGKRASKTVGGATTGYTYDVNASLPVLLDDGSRRYVWGLGLAYAVDSSGVLVYHSDGLGSVRDITDGAGVVVQTYRYDEYGVPTDSQGSVVQPFQYTGEQYDPETGLLYLRARMYDAATGMFTGRDVVAGRMGNPASLNRYTYVLGNPMGLVDPSGLYEYKWDWAIGPVSRVGSPEGVMAYFQQHPREIFPFDLGGCDVITPGECDLGVVPGVGSVHSRRETVSISQITSTSFLFTVPRPGVHFDTAGSTIRFSTFEREGSVYLQQKARALQDGVFDLWKDLVFPPGAWAQWSQMAENLRRAVDPFHILLVPGSL